MDNIAVEIYIEMVKITLLVLFTHQISTTEVIRPSLFLSSGEFIDFNWPPFDSAPETFLAFKEQFPKIWHAFISDYNILSEFHIMNMINDMRAHWQFCWLSSTKCHEYQANVHITEYWSHKYSIILLTQQHPIETT